MLGGSGGSEASREQAEWQEVAGDDVASSASYSDEDDFPGELNQYKKRGDGGHFTATLSTAGENDDRGQALPEMSGWVDKTSPAWFLPLQPRFFRLKEKQLRWYENDLQDARMLGHLDLDLIDIQIQRQYGARPAQSRTKTCCMGRKAGTVSELFVGAGQRVSFTIVPKGSRRVFELSLSSEPEAEAWVSGLLLHKSRSLQLGSSGSKVVKQEGWWHSPHITPEQMLKCANTGDLLLFRSRGTKPKLIRMASGTKGRYDHVGLIVQLADSQIGILEATGGEGVGILPWKTFIDNGWHLLYPELALRKVHFPRTSDRLLSMQAWISEVLGKPYALSISKLMARTSIAAEGEENYFCSQLCAKALKVLGVLPDGPEDKPSSGYWPSTFSAKMPHIPCKENCRFDDVDLIVDFSLSDDPEKYKQHGEGKQRDDTTKWT